MGLCSGNKNIWTRAHHLLIRLGHRGKWICLEKKRRQAAKILIVLDHRPPPPPPQKKAEKKPSRWLLYLELRNERTTTKIQCCWDKYVGRDVSGNMCALCANAGGILWGGRERGWGGPMGRAGWGGLGQRGWQWLRRWGFDGKVTKSSNKMRLVD